MPPRKEKAKPSAGATGKGGRAARGRGENGHDAVVRRLLSARAPVPAPSDEPDAPSPRAMAEVARRFGGEVVPELAAFSGPALSWRVEEARLVTWDLVQTNELASPLTRDMALAACIACDGGFLPALMGALFGSLQPDTAGTGTYDDTARRDPTATEVCVFAQLAVRLRDAIEPSLDHAPPGSPAEVMRLFTPRDTTPLLVTLSAAARGREGRLMVFAMRDVAGRFLPRPATARPAARATAALPLVARAELAGPAMTLAAVRRLAPGRVLAVAPAGDAAPVRLTLEGREVARGHMGAQGPRRTVAVSQETHHG